MSDERPAWDDERGRELVGKTVLLGLTFVAADGEVIEQTQRHGVIEDTDAEQGISVRLVGPGRAWHGELYTLPPDLSNFVDAAPGSYRLRATGETVVDPDLTSTWEIRSPAADESTPEQREARLAEARRLGFPAD
jgi:hypothetical protein